MLAPQCPPAAGWISSAEAGAVSVRQPPGTVASNGFEVHGLGRTASLTYFVWPALLYLHVTPDLLSCLRLISPYHLTLHFGKPFNAN